MLLGVAYGYRLSPTLRVPLHEGGSDIGQPVVDRWTLHIASVLGLWDQLQVGVALPVVVDQRSESFADARVRAAMPLAEGGGAGDITLGLKWRFFKAEVTSMALAVESSIPTGRLEALYGEPGVAITPRLVAGLRLGPWEAAADFGARLRTKEGMLPDGRPFGHQILAGLATRIRAAEWLSLVAEVVGRIAPDAYEFAYGSAVEIGGGVAVDVGGGVAAIGGASAGLVAGGYGNPSVRGWLAVRWAPSLGFGDADADGIRDRYDACPSQPEDLDSLGDSDGCPDEDHDGDNILDAHDGCPAEPEDRDDFGDEDGCPELDNDGDTVRDTLDACILVQEDPDGFEDEDGCPDLDHDRDGINVPADQCPDEREDFDGFNDEDGCVDPHNDDDGIPDTHDICPDEPEDFDGFDDEDGCVDPDNDGDGIPDAHDVCPDEPEDLDGVEDHDGCSEPRPSRGRRRW